MTELTLEILRSELAPIRAAVDGVPIINRALVVVQPDIRALRAAFNDFALQHVTQGEIGALHHDVNRVQEENRELERRIITLERLLAERESK